MLLSLLFNVVSAFNDLQELSEIVQLPKNNVVSNVATVILDWIPPKRTKSHKKIPK